MHIDTVFTSFLAFDKIELNNKDLLIKKCYDAVSIDKHRVSDGYNQSLFIDPSDTVFNPLVKEVHTRFDWLHKEFGFADTYHQEITQTWININNNPNIGRPHPHPQKFFSAVYYPQAPKGSGHLSFINPNPQHPHVIRPEYISNFNGFNSAEWDIPPSDDLCIFFPSYLWHYVNPCNNTEDRISIAFNTEMIQNDT